MKALNFFIFLLFIFSSAVYADEAKNKIRHVKYIFLMIGDGMGTMQRHCAETYKKSKAAKPENVKLLMNRFPVTGFSGTLNSKGKKTDSAAAGTALACGEKTVNKMIGMEPSGKRKLRSVAYDAQERGMKVGIISSVPVDHATPACFYANVPSRHMYYQIAMSIPESKFDFLGGSGSIGANEAHSKKSPIKNAEEKGYKIIKDKKSLLALKKNPKTQKVLSLCNLKYDMDIDSSKDLTLAELTDSAIKFLDNPKGFFLMVEGGKIDWACHKNDSASFIKETLAFDNAVNVAYGFYLKHPEDTLIVVTADHETGGLLQASGAKENFDLKSAEKKLSDTIDKQKISLEKFYYDCVSKWKKNKTPFEKALKEINDKLGLNDLTAQEKASIKKAFGIFMTEKNKSKRSPELVKMYGSRNPVVIACAKIVSERCGISWTAFNHSGAPVMTTAIGKDSELFKGKYQNTNICNILKAAILSTKQQQ